MEDILISKVDWQFVQKSAVVVSVSCWGVNVLLLNFFPGILGWVKWVLKKI